MTTPASTIEKVGVIGLGAMGRPLVNSLLEAGYSVHAYDISAAAIDAAVQQGATAAASPADLAAGVDLFLTVLPYGEDVEAALFAPGGAAEGARRGAIFVDASTIDPMTINRLAQPLQQKGIDVLDAGLAGSPKMARERRLTLLVGGDEAVFDRAAGVLRCLADQGKLLYTGQLGSAKVVKLLNNMVGAVQMAAISEAFNLAVKAGVDPKVLYDGMSGSMGNCWALHVRPPYPGIKPGSPADLDFEPDFSVDYMIKDLSYALQTGRSLEAALLLAGQVHQLYLATSARGEGAKDFAAIVHTVQALSKP
ncbi:MAG: NAD(P)-dependent oxidoreductase [Chloroflexi bacterium]|nr:NAD(P)-dependent oxidoreductase [Chloroflexota bacterium]